MKNTMFALATVVVAAAGANAGIASTDMEMQLQQWGFPLSPGATTVNFKQFDTMPTPEFPSGTRVLKAVQLDVGGKIQAMVTAENNSTIPVNNFAVNLTGIVDFMIGPATLGLGIIQNSPVVMVAATDNGGVPNGSGPDFHDFGLLSGGDTDKYFVFSDADVAPWIGNGNIIGTINGSGGFAVQGTADGTVNLIDFGAAGTAKLTYFFNIIPTPGSIALLGLGGLVALRRRRA
jgi:hypothetical protein